MGLGLPRPRVPRGAAAARASRRASSRSGRSRSWSLPALVYLLSYVPWMRQGHSVADVLAHAARHLELPRQPDRHPHLLQPLVDLALAVSAHLVLLVLGRGVRARDRGARQPRDLVGRGARVAVGARERDPLARPAARLLRRRLLPALPALGPLAAHAQLPPLPVRGDPLRLPVARDAARPPLGRRARRSSRAATSCWWWRSSCCSCPSSRRCRCRPRLWGFRFPTGGGLWTWFPSWI